MTDASSGTPRRAPLRIALPNKGRLAARSLELFEQAGLRATFLGDGALSASLGPDFEAILVRAADIPEFVADGAADVGVTGADLVVESGRPLVELLDLGFGACRLVVAVRNHASWQRASELPGGTRVATSFPRITRDYFRRLGTAVEVAVVTGATEVAPHLGVADVVVDLTSTGSTLRVNGLRETDTILDSSARLVASRKATADPAVRPTIDELAAALGSVLRARARRYLMANVPRTRLEEVRRILPGLNGPTIVDVLDDDRWAAAHAVVHADRVYETISALRAVGAEGILVTRIERLMP